jgi:hypothetical protein
VLEYRRMETYSTRSRYSAQDVKQRAHRHWPRLLVAWRWRHLNRLEQRLAEAGRRMDRHSFAELAHYMQFVRDGVTQ